jgi:3-oxoacyl-(acyl-carrier-protein) synthase
MFKTKISIVSIASISALGNSPENIWQNYLLDKTFISAEVFNKKQQFVATIPVHVRTEVTQLRASNNKYKLLDDSVLYAILTSRKAIDKASWDNTAVFGINIGSSRGATQLFEKYHEDFIKTGNSDVLTSPATTLGNISSWVAHDLKSHGPDISHSITCSTALHALLNGVAWLQAGLVDKFIVGGSEAPLTAFTISQMQALKIYSKTNACRALDLEKTSNSMILGEGAAMACLELGISKNAIAMIEGIGYATDILEHSISISTDADCFQKSMKMALQNTSIKDVDAIVMHAPGTIKGDLSEFKAIQKVFGDNLPLLTTNKWKIGHTFGASGMLSVELAILMMQHNRFIEVPFAMPQKNSKDIKKVLVNAVGFGGNAVSILLGIPER